LNENSYPNLYYPELYLLEGGYKSFYESFKLYCCPQTYKPMLHAEHQEDLKRFRAKAKSWEVSRHQIVSKCTEHLLQSKNAQMQEDKENGVAPSSQQPHKVIKMKHYYLNTPNNAI
jgi:hypothetical protein